MPAGGGTTPPFATPYQLFETFFPFYLLFQEGINFHTVLCLPINPTQGCAGF